MPDRLTIDTIDAELSPGARNAVRVCLQLKPDERITIITDEATRDIAAALQAEVEEIGSDHAVFVLENYDSRPLTKMPRPILDDLATSQVSIFAAQSLPGELTARRDMTAVVDRHHIRHGHMVNITRQIMLEGMRADFREIDALSQRLIDRARRAARIKCRTPHGTDFEGEFSPKLKWLKTSGLISPEKWGNLPGGEIFTAQNKELLEEFRAYTSTDQNSNRVGEFAIGTNTACTHVIGNILQDEKIPGIHIAFGHPYSEHTGADWTSKTHIDCVGRDFDIWFDDEPVMRAGKFLV